MAELDPRRLLQTLDRHASLDHLIAMTEAAGRPKDLLMASEYRVIRRPRDEDAR